MSVPENDVSFPQAAQLEAEGITELLPKAKCIADRLKWHMTENEHPFADRLREQDRDRYLTSLFAPAKLRDDLHVLYMFNLEVARIRELVSEPMIGDIRLAWWRENIEGIYQGTARKHEVLDALSGVVARHDLPRSLFDKILEARQADFEDVPFATLSALKDYAQATAGSLMGLGARVLGEGDVPDQFLRPAAVAWAFSGLLRSVLFHAANGHVALPRHLLLQHNIDAHDLVSGYVTDDVRAVIRGVAEPAFAAVAEFEATAKKLPKAARPVFLPVALAAHDLKVLRAVDYDPFDPKLQSPQMGRILGLMRRGFMGW